MSVVFTVPSSKSISQRALIAASLADGLSTVRGLSRCDDTQVVIDAVRQLGAWVDDSGDPVFVRGAGDYLKEITSPFSPVSSGPDRNFGTGASLSSGPVDCGESAAALRFLLPLFLQSGKRCLFTGRGRLLERPQSVYEKLWCSQGGSFENNGAYIAAEGRLKPGTFKVPGNVSSQFISGLLFILPLLDGDSVIEIDPPLESAPYVDLTLDVLSRSGIKAQIIKNAGLNSGTPADGSDTGVRTQIKVPGRQRYMPFDITVEADWSSAAPLLTAAHMLGAEAEVRGLNYSSLQADRAITGLLKDFGRPGQLKAIEADISDCPDLGPLLFAAATQAEGTSVFRGTKRLKLKESDRITCMERQLKKLGCSISSGGDTVTVTGRTPVKGGINVSGCSDHRIVMALAVLGLTAEKPVVIEGADAVNKSFPGFFEQLDKLSPVWKR